MTDSQNNHKKDLSILSEKKDDSLSTLTASSLADELEKEKASKKIERFFYLLTIGFFIWVFSVKVIDNTALSFAAFIFYIITIIGFAEWCGVWWITKNLHEFISLLSSFFKKSDKNNKS